MSATANLDALQLIDAHQLMVSVTSSSVTVFYDLPGGGVGTTKADFDGQDRMAVLRAQIAHAVARKAEFK